MSSPNQNNLNGLFESRGDELCQIIFGELQHVPDPATADALYGGMSGLTFVPNGQTALQQQQPSVLQPGACLLLGSTSRKVYLFSNNKKYWIANPDTLIQYEFNGHQYEVPDSVTDAIESGDDITLRGGDPPA